MNYKQAGKFLILIISWILLCTSIWAFDISNPTCGIETSQSDTALLPFITSPLSPSQILSYSASPPPGPPLHSPDTAWVESTLANMSLDEKIGQLLIVWYSSVATGLSDISTYHVGGMIFSQEYAQDVFNAISTFQAASPTALWFAADFEAGTGARIYDGTYFPLNMGSGAVDDTTLAEKQGRIVAREARSMGIQIGFGPVVDVNTEPLNPIISTRSYSDDPERVTRLAKAFISGARAEGMLCTLKHYPGHGATAGDSHSGLPVVNASWDEMMNTHIKPYSNLLQDTTVPVDFIMTAHVWYPAFDPGATAWPATLSTTAVQGILRNQLDYDGVIISDAFGMAGLQIAAATPQAAVYALQAGLDIILMPPVTSDVFTGIYSALSTGDLTISRIDESVRRVLRAKSMVGLPAEKFPTQWIMDSTMHHPEHQSTAKEIAQKSVTLVGDRAGNLPISTTQRVLCLVFNPTSYIFYNRSNSNFTNQLKSYLPTLGIRTVSTSVSSTQRAQILSDATTHYDKVILASYDWVTVYSSNQRTLINSLLNAPVPLIYVSFGSPYHVLQFPTIKTFLCAYCSQDNAQEYMADIIFGATSPTGILPVQLDWPGLAIQDWELY